MLATLLLIQALQLSDAVPAELMRAVAARERLASGQVVWTRTDHRRMPGREFLHISRYALNGDLISESRGDQDGWVVVEHGSHGISKFPELRMQTDEGLWAYRETSASCEYWKHDGDLGPEESNPPPTPADLWDIRWIGSAPSFKDSFWRRQAALISPGEAGNAWEWSTQAVDEGRGRRIRVAAQSGDRRREWLLDPERDYLIESTVDIAPDLKVETISEYVDCDGAWFPESVKRMENGELVETISILSAAFNQPDDARAFTPNDIGVEVGVNVSPQNFRVDGVVLFWTGSELIDIKEYRRAVRAGELQIGPLMKHIRTHGPEGSPYLTDEQRAEYAALRRARGFEFKPTYSDWERYVRDFIARFRLDDEQAQKAMLILRDCQGRANSYLNRKAAELEQRQRAVDQQRSTKDALAVAQAVDALQTLRAPLNDIFDEHLKPRLERIPTTAQRRSTQAAEASSRPAGP